MAKGFLLVSFFFFITFSMCVFGAQSSSKVQALLDLHDYQEAYKVAKSELKNGGEDSLWLLAIRAAFHSCGEKQALTLWKSYLNYQPIPHPTVAEEMALGIVRAHYTDSSPILRTQALLTSMNMQTKESVEAALLGMEDPHLFVRLAVLQSSGAFRDKRVLKKVSYLLKKEKTAAVLEQLVKLSGLQKNVFARQALLDLLPRYAEESDIRNAIFTALSELGGKPSAKEIDQLLQSKETGVLELALLQAYRYPNSARASKLFFLLSHHEPSIREKALLALSKLRFSIDQEIFRQNIHPLFCDSHFNVKLTALYSLTLIDSASRFSDWEKALRSGTYHERLLAASYLSATGPAGEPISSRLINEMEDPLLRLHLALHILSHNGSKQQQAVCAVEQVLKSFGKKLRVKQQGPALLFTDSSQEEESLLPVEMTDQYDLQARLGLLGILLFKNPEHIETVRSFFHSKSIEVTLTALELALKEGGWPWAEEIERLLKDPNPDVRFHVALLLGLNENPLAEAVFQETLKGFDKDRKVIALRVMGKIRTKSVRCVLFNSLSSPSARIRLSAAAAIVDYYNH